MASDPPNKSEKQDLKGSNYFQVTKLYPGTNARILTWVQKYPASNKVKFTISGIQLKIIRHAKKQENMTHHQGNNETDLELIRIL